jgi:hypothetical protein
MDQKQLINTLTSLAGKIEKAQADCDHLKLEFARSERIKDLEVEMAGIRANLKIMYWFLGVVITSVVGSVVVYLSR